MEFICVGGAKLKIVLSEDERRELGIECIDGEPGGRELRRTLRTLLHKASERTPFRVAGERVLVQIYPTRDGGCELFVTKLSIAGVRERDLIDESSSLTTYQGREAVYRFETLEPLLRAARCLLSFDGRCDLYVTLEGVYYLVLEENLLDGISDTEPIGEFGQRVATLPLGINGEWGTQLARGNALSYLRELY